MTRQDTVNLTTDIKQYGKNGDVFNAGRRTTDNLNKAIGVALSESITALVHANSRAQLVAIEKRFLTQAVMEPTQQPHSKLKQMATLAESTTILSIIESYRHSNDKALTLRILSSLTQEFTLFFLNKRFNLNISSYLWSKANMYIPETISSRWHFNWLGLQNCQFL
jgi:hypothetical protein